MLIKIVNSLLILFIVYMGFKQGWAMLNGKAEMLAMFGKWHLGRQTVLLFGAVTLLSALLILLPPTFVLGNFLMAASILFIICMQLFVKDLKGALIELPFMLMNLLAVNLQYPFLKR